MQRLEAPHAWSATTLSLRWWHWWRTNGESGVSDSSFCVLVISCWCCGSWSLKVRTCNRHTTDWRTPCTKTNNSSTLQRLACKKTNTWISSEPWADMPSSHQHAIICVCVRNKGYDNWTKHTRNYRNNRPSRPENKVTWFGSFKKDGKREGIARNTERNPKKKFDRTQTVQNKSSSRGVARPMSPLVASGRVVR